ncbi:Hsp33 family molecular chaperone HslO [Gorillibacterium massiliense]|uniref:Hsp33 family molecular chaperone HslO n=1 Tax=Gorillibacterium massiliense TaxID=1280390 RepID=UPI0004AEE880|nr:Hsp33 family molecular chaperone HslO [Gorillibacterium massiliense]
MNDHLIRATALGGKVRAFAALTTGIVNELQRRHQASPVAIAALGRTVTAGAMMGAMLKGDERLTLQIKGDGPVGQIVVDANANGEVRGYVENPVVDLPLKPNGKLDVSAAVGEGFLYVTKDLGLKEPYQGSTPIVSGEIADDFTYYFAKSEQTPSAVALGVLVDVDYKIKASGGFILQLLPGLDEEEIEEMERKLASLKPVTTLLDQGATLEEILSSVVEGVQVLETMDLVFKCRCSQERVEQTLISLGKDELNAILEEDGQTEIVCHFCNEAYHFSEQEIKGLLDKM